MITASPTWRRTAWVLGTWLAASLLFLPQAMLIDAQQPQPRPWWLVAASNAAIFAVWAALTPFVLSLARQFPFERGRLSGAVAAHLGLGLGFALVHVLAMTALHWPFLRDPVPVVALAINFLAGLGATNVLLYFGVVAAGHALSYLERYRAGERARATAELAALRSQLHPHFLFNALNAISELVHRDASQAEHLILRLADLLRRVLASGDVHETTLAEELDFTRAYLEIQQALMGERLRVVIDVPEALMAWRVPSLLLQPLVENAVRHGLAARRAGGTLTLSARDEGGALQLVVADDGSGAIGAPREGIGLGNTRARLASLYGDTATLGIESDASGFRVRIRLPGPKGMP